MTQDTRSRGGVQNASTQSPMGTPPGTTELPGVTLGSGPCSGLRFSNRTVQWTMQWHQLTCCFFMPDRLHPRSLFLF